MRGSIKLRYGNVFDEPCDLAVLPCATDGGLTDFVRRTLVHYGLSGPPPDLALGELRVVELTGGQPPAPRLGFAAVRNHQGSSAEVLRGVGDQLGALARNPSIRLISTPLLGTGAGGVEHLPAVEALTVGFRHQAPSGATLSICTLHKAVFKRLEEHFSRSFLAREEPLRVFLSYSAPEDSEQLQWVATLAEFLRGHGINSRFDRWHLHRGVDLQDWMNREVAQADKVIIVSDEAYAAKADGRQGGVGWETMLIQSDIARLPADTRKYLVVVRSPVLDAGTPFYLRSRFVIHCAPGTPAGPVCEQLLKELYEVEIAPPIGEMPIYL